MRKKEKTIVGEVLVKATLKEVWDAWTTEEGAKSFFAPDCMIELKPGGAYEMYFALEYPPGLRGGEGCTVMAIEPMRMFAFTWNAPPNLPTIRGQFTHVILRFDDVLEGTRVSLHHDGWGTSLEWEQAFTYFESAWLQMVLPRMKYHFEHGSIDWENPPDLG